MTAINLHSIKATKALLPAAIMTGVLLLLMTTLIANDNSAATDKATVLTNIFQADYGIEQIYRKRNKPEETPIQRPSTPRVSLPTNRDEITPTFENPIKNLSIIPSVPSTATDEKSLLEGLQAGSDNRAAAVKYYVQARYPATALQKRQEGYVDLIFDITPQGATTNIRVTESEPRRVFDRSAILAVKKWKYKPQRVAGKTVATSGMTARVTFVLDK